MNRPVGGIDVDGDERLVVHRPADTHRGWWDRVVRYLAPAAVRVEDDRVLVGTTQTPVLRRLLATGPAAGSDWRWTERAAKAAEHAERVATSLRAVMALTPAEQTARHEQPDLATLGFTRQLRPFQRDAVARLLTANGGADFSVPGSGKTTVAYAVWTAMRARRTVQGLLIVAPPSAFEAWHDEASACFAKQYVPRIRIRPDRISNSDQVVLINYERLSDAASLSAIRAWAQNRKILVIFDEAHRAKAGAASRRGAAAAHLARHADASMVLTGTPMPNRESDLVAIFDLVWPGHGQRLVDGDLAHLRDRAFVRVTKADLGLPPMHINIENVALDPIHRRVYDAMVKAVDDWATGSEATAAEAGRALLRVLAATTNPAAVFKPGAPWAIPDRSGPAVELADVLNDPTSHLLSAKIARAAQIVADNRSRGRKTLVWSNFVDNVRVISEALSAHQPATVTGSTPVEDPSAPSDRTREINRFRHDPQCWVLIATPQTLGEGISLHHACTDQVHVDRGYAAGTWLQAIDRTHRLGLGPHAQVTCTVIQAQDTIDARVDKVLNEKVAAMAHALQDHTLRPVADPTIIPGDPIAAILGDLDALSELLAIGRHAQP